MKITHGVTLGLATALVGVTVFAGSGAAVAASPLPSASDAQSTVERLAPGVVNDSVPADTAEQVQGTTVDTQQQGGASAVALTSDTQPAVKITLDGLSGASKHQSGDFSVVQDADDTAYVQPTGQGVRLLSYDTSATGALTHDYSFDFAVPVTSETEADGALLFRDATTGISVGTVSAPWAVDAAGKTLPTHYQWHGGVLTQTVDADPATTTFPVLADPNWTYTLLFTIGKSTPNAAWKELHRCFNCNFDVDGAPQAFPAEGQTLPLKIAKIGNFSVHRTLAYNYTNPNVRPGLESGFQLVANKGHVDGEGSTIGFDYLIRSTDHNLVMSVSAFIKNDFIGGNSLYKSLASEKWAEFSGRLQRNLGLQVQPGPPPTPPKS
ncbi:hypothetical protein HP467_06960 [Curtobacterium albidum]|uniref:Uncharacterized protein n=1 Tax=Curtobacterium citreum TaxID=2036 RepID=A0A850DWM9_9MICO|nr:hypothetical protein [Curtobacterium albidum]NUU27853.1 hypothetical protein [Curtobacterium albidum]